MIEALQKAGFAGVDAEQTPAGTVLHARLMPGSVPFTATAEGTLWRFALHWPLRASAAQLAEWAADHPDAPMDIHQGETRLSLVLHDGDVAAIQRWARLAPEAVAACVRWRRAQRAPGEGY